MRSITFKPVVYAQYRRRDGSYAVRIRVTFDRKSRYIPTNVSVVQSQLTKGLNIKDASVKDALDGIIAAFRKASQRLNFFALAEMDIDSVVAFLLNNVEERFLLDFPTYAREKISRMGAGAKNYKSALNSLTAFVGRDQYDISVITSSFMTRYESWLVEKHGQGARAVSLYTNAVAKLHGLARDEYNDEELGEIRIKNPFQHYHCPKQAAGRHRSIQPAIVNLMLLHRDELTGLERLGVDVFLLSFALMGMNAPDLYEADRLFEGVLTYNRHKTRGRRDDRAEMKVSIDGRFRWLCDEYAGRDGHVFNFARRYARYENFERAVNQGLHQYEERLGLDTTLTLYVARHTWATIARSSVCNIDKYVVNECICHVDASMRVTDIYADKDWKVLWRANEVVQRLFHWEH